MRRYISASETHSGTCHCSTLHNVVFQHCFFFLSCVFLLSRQEGVGVETSLRLVGWLVSFQIILSMRVPLTVDHCSAWQAGRVSSPLICAWGGQAARPRLRYRGVDDVKWHSVSSHKTTARRRPALPGPCIIQQQCNIPPHRDATSLRPLTVQTLFRPCLTPAMSLRAATQVQTHTCIRTCTNDQVALVVNELYELRVSCKALITYTGDIGRAFCPCQSALY